MLTRLATALFRWTFKVIDAALDSALPEERGLRSPRASQPCRLPERIPPPPPKPPVSPLREAIYIIRSTRTFEGGEGI